MEQLKQNVKNKPFSDYERNLAIALITKRVTILDEKKIDNVSMRAKKSEWDKVASEFNSSQNVQRVTGERLKKFWANMKNKTRDAKTHQIQLKRTGSAPPEEPMSDTDIQMLSAIPFPMATVKVPIDSDIDDDGDDDTLSCLPKPKRFYPAEISRAESNTPISVKVLHHKSTPPTPQDTYEMVDPLSETQNPEPTPSSDNPSKRKSQLLTSHKTFEEMKIKVLEQVFDHNNKKFELYMKHQKELHELDLAYKKKKIKLLLQTAEESDDI